MFILLLPLSTRMAVFFLLLSTFLLKIDLLLEFTHYLLLNMFK